MGKERALQIASRFKPRKVVVLDIIPFQFDDPLIALYQCDISDRRKLRVVADCIMRDVLLLDFEIYYSMGILQ